MKNIVKLITPEEIHAYVYSLLQSDVLKKSYDENGLVYDIVDCFARLPRFFYEPTNLEIEAPHFSPWWGGIQLREYDNKVVQDLYYLHEIFHIVKMPDMQAFDAQSLKYKIRDNEHEASTFTEMTVYLEWPELRKESFSHPVFVDRFIFPQGDFNRPDKVLLERWSRERETVANELRQARNAVLVDRESNFENDLAAFWLKRFYSQGKDWTAIWTNPRGKIENLPKGGRWRMVEEAMVKFRDECDVLGREKALDNHIAWLQSDVLTDGTGIPFFREAKLFSESYTRHKQLYFNALAEIGSKTEAHKGGARFHYPDTQPSP